MKLVVLRDDDTNALTPPEYLERLYRPFLDRGLPINLATIPAVSTAAKKPDGSPEGFLLAHAGADLAPAYVPLRKETALARYLRGNPGYHIVQHGCHHHPLEFDRSNRAAVSNDLEKGRQLLEEAGFAPAETFVAPHDKFSRVSYREVAKRFGVISTGWFESRRLPRTWWPNYLLARILGRPHWRIGKTILLSHPGCLLSYLRPYDSMLESVKKQIQRQRITVIVTHWWEYFREGRADDPFIRILHDLAGYLERQPEIRIVSFATLTERGMKLR